MLDFAFTYFSVLTGLLIAALFLCATVLAVAFIRAETWPDRFSYIGMWFFCVGAGTFVFLSYL